MSSIGACRTRRAKSGWISCSRLVRLSRMREGVSICRRSHRRSRRLAARIAGTSGVVTISALEAISTATAPASVMTDPMSQTTMSYWNFSAPRIWRAADALMSSPSSPRSGASSTRRPVEWT